LAGLVFPVVGFLLSLSKRAKIIRKVIFLADLYSATIVSLYLLPQTNEKIREKLKKELKKGTKILVTGFEISGIKLQKVNTNAPIYGPIRLYKSYVVNRS
jgi:hypothetical protein